MRSDRILHEIIKQTDLSLIPSSMEQIYHNRFYTLGTRMHIILPRVDEQMGMRIFTHCKHEAERIERKISRFIPQSDLSRLNKVAFEKYALVDEEFFEILLAFIEEWHI